MSANHPIDYAFLKSFLSTLFPPYPLEYSVTAELQQKEISALKETLGNRRFFFVTNLETYEIEQTHGVERWLGYSERDFKMKKYLDIIHPGRKKSVLLIAYHLYNTLCRGDYTLNFMVQRYSSLIAMKHHRGHYLLANKISSVFQYDKQNRLTSCLHEFTIINDEYNGEPLAPKFFTADGNDEERGIEILKKTMEHFLKMRVFSPREIQVARKIAYEPGIKQPELAVWLGSSVDDLHQYYARFLRKAREFFHRDFNNTLEAAIYLRKEGLL